MKLFWTVAKTRILPNIGWIACLIPSIFIGGFIGSQLGLWVDFLLMKFANKSLFRGWDLFMFLYAGVVIGLIVMQIIRILCWIKLHRRYLSEYEGWAWKHTIGIVLFDETVWLLTLPTICLLGANVISF